MAARCAVALLSRQDTSLFLSDAHLAPAVVPWYVMLDAHVTTDTELRSQLW